MKTILVPIDFTTASRNASEYAVSLARAMDADVHLLHVYMEPLPVGNVPDYNANTVAALRIEKAALVDKEVTWLKETSGMLVKGHTELGFKGDAIKDTATSLNADLVVMGVKAAHKNKILGNTVMKMIRKSDKPLLLIPEEAVYRPLKHIVLAIDFNEIVSSAGMDVFFSLVRNTGASVSVLHVQKTGEEMEPAEVAEKLQMGRVLSEITYRYELLEADDVNEGILNFTNKHPADLLVMIAHQHTVFERLFSQIHTRAISTETGLPLLVLKMHQPFS